MQAVHRRGRRAWDRRRLLQGPGLPEHALDVLTRCYPDSGAARAFVDTLGAARAPDDEDGPAADPRPDGVLVLSDVDMFLCEADALGSARRSSTTTASGPCTDGTTCTRRRPV